MHSKIIVLVSLAAAVGVAVHGAAAQGAETDTSTQTQVTRTSSNEPQHFMPEQKVTHGSVTIEGHRIDYDAYAGTLVVHPKGWSDVPQNAPKDAAKNPPAEASMFYVAYIKSGEKDESRPVMFLYNGGPGSSTVWLHMGAFGPRRVVTGDGTRTPAAPYQVINNDSSLLDVSDLVFVDAPGTGFSRIAGKDREKAFYGVDQDAYAFSDFIMQFLGKYGRWNSPKYLYGESYGTTRSAVLIDLLETQDGVDFNGVIMQSQILNFDEIIGAPQRNPGVDLPYELALPTYAATAWYHHELPDPQQPLETLLTQVEQFALNGYAHALQAGWTLSDADRNAVATQLHQFTGLPVPYIVKADLRITGPEFEKTLEGSMDETTGRYDTRFSGPTMDPLSEGAAYDPQTAAIESAYVSAFNDYVRKQLEFGQGKRYVADMDIPGGWDWKHQRNGLQAPSVMFDLATALKYDPDLHVMLNEGYFDLATPFFTAVYDLQHLQIPASLGKNIEFAFYPSGHMIYVHAPALQKLHDNVAAFVRRTEGPAPSRSGN